MERLATKQRRFLLFLATMRCGLEASMSNAASLWGQFNEGWRGGARRGQYWHSSKAWHAQCHRQMSCVLEKSVLVSWFCLQLIWPTQGDITVYVRTYSFILLCEGLPLVDVPTVRCAFAPLTTSHSRVTLVGRALIWTTVLSARNQLFLVELRTLAWTVLLALTLTVFLENLDFHRP